MISPPDADPALAVPLPVIVGGDIGAYSIARAFHEAFGVTSVVVSSVMTGNINHSRIVRPWIEPKLADDARLVAAVRAIAREYPGRKVLLLGAADWYVEAIVRNRMAWTEMIVPYVEESKLVRATDKVEFGAAAESHGVPYPETTVIPGTGPIPDVSGMSYPVIVKAASTSAFHAVEYAGKSKVFTAHTEADLMGILTDARAGGYAGQFLVQRRIRGGDSHMRVATCFAGRDGVTDAVVGRVLLEEHTPGALGNPAAVVVESHPDIEAGMRVLVEALGWSGHANFDVKWDPETSTHVFFELNPRLGRSNYYLTASGTNPAVALAREYAQVPAPQLRTRPSRVYSIVPLPLLLRYAPDRATRNLLLGAWLRCRITHPLWYWPDANVARWLYVQVAKLNHYRKFHRYYRPVQATMDA